jgi:Cu-processing system permease protein
MKSIWIIASNTYREIIRDRILYGMLVFALLLIGLSLALGQLSFAEQVRISVNFGFTAIHLSAVIISIFVGSTLVTKEVDKKTVLTLLARPISRLEFLLGKGLGLIFINVTVVSCLALILVVTFLLLGADLNLSFFVALHGVFLESAILLAFSLFFGAFATPVMVVPFCIGIFLIGHWMNSLSHFLGKREDASLSMLAKFLETVLPNLESFNWRTHVIYDDVVPWAEFAKVNIYAVFWFVLLISLSAFFFGRRDFD